MVSNSVLDMKDYTRFKLERCLKDKMGSMVLDEGGLSSPLSISLIIPTRFGREEGRKIERETLKGILSECSKLVDVGYLDEIMVIDATRHKHGEPDFRVLQNIIRVAYEELGLFREQVNLLNKYGSENEKGKRGLTDFFIKVVHQFDTNIPKVLAKFGVFGVTGIFGMPYGKGAALWLSVPMTSGDILCFVDSDILNFKKEFVASLCHPIVYSWNLRRSGIEFVKAYYRRLTRTPHLASDEMVLGGRASRLFAIPLIQSVTQTLKLYAPLRTIKYPLAGEFALSRRVIEELTFSTAYSIEISSLFQILDLVGTKSMAQVNLKAYHHIGQEFPKLERIARQVGTSILEKIGEKRNKPLTREECRQILSLYQKKAKKMIRNNAKVISRLKTSAELVVPNKLVYSKEEEEEHLGVFLNVLENVLSESRQKPIELSSWSQIKEKTGNYFVFREILRRRSNQSTWSRLKECNLIRRSQ